MSTTEIAACPKKGSPNFLELPLETQKEIVALCSQSDLICLALVSRHFRDLAAAQLYRNFHIVFPDEDDPAFDSPIDGLASGLDTFVTSDYNYAQHLRELCLDTLSGGDKAETAYKPYLYNLSCGKFLNTLLLMTLRKAKSLESFKWDIRVELSRPVYQSLHQIESLNKLHLRLQAGPSLWEAPPPLPFSHAQSTTTLGSPNGHVPESSWSSGSDIFTQPAQVPGNNGLFYIPNQTSHSISPPSHKPASKSKSSKKSSVNKEPPTLSGFKKLKKLSILDIDTLDLVTEIKSCVRNSAGTLTKLKLSFSDALGNQARKPAPTADPDDSDPEDEFQVVPVPAPGSGYTDDASEPAKAFRAQEERKIQESVLGRIFDVENFVVKPIQQRKTREKNKEAKEQKSGDAAQNFIAGIKDWSNRLMDLQGAGELSESQQELLDMITNVATEYAAAMAKKTSASSDDDKKDEVKEDTGTDETKSEDKVADDGEAAAPSLNFESNTAKTKESQGDIKPEDINIEEPEEQLAVEYQEPVPKEAASVDSLPSDTACHTPESSSNTDGGGVSLVNRAATTPNVEKAMSNLAVQKVNFKILAEKLGVFESQANELNQEIQQLRGEDGTVALDRLADAEKRMKDLNLNIEDTRQEINTIEAEIDDAEKQIPSRHDTEDDEARSQLITDYIRATRGIALKTLSIYLIPVKPSVLSHALDLRVLERLTLLNVGPQAPIWTHLAKENKESPLALRKIFTDHVSMPLLTFVNQLKELHEFFILERDNKYKPESFATKTTVTMDQIRRLVLKKQLPHLKRLMIKNMVDTSWDLDEKTIMLVCKRGQKLEELACSMGIKHIHTFMQNLPGLSELRALHIIQLRNDDTCVWVMRETRRFLVDNVSHHPNMKLEWVSIDEDEKAERIIRPVELPKKDPKKSKKSKGKQKAKTANGAAGGGSNSDLFPVIPSLDAWDASSESEDDEEELGQPRIRTVEGVRFYDVWGVRIFKQEVLTGKL